MSAGANYNLKRKMSLNERPLFALDCSEAAIPILGTFVFPPNTCRAGSNTYDKFECELEITSRKQ
jgi:hypothetical protein